VKRHAFDLATLLVAGTVAVVAVAFFAPSARDVALHVYVLGVGGVALALLLAFVGRVVPRARRSAFDDALDGAAPREERIADLERMEREVTLALATEYDLHRRLLPLLREAAAMRLERTGRALGPATAGRWWELLRPDRPPPEDRFAPGASASELRALLDDLELLDAPAAGRPGRM
jgi:hypothetical protein